MLKVPEMKILEFANSIDPDEVAHYETFLKFCRHKFCCQLFWRFKG